MSLVIAEIKDGVVYMGADTLKSYKDDVYSNRCESKHKIKKMPFGVLIGTVGLVSVTDVFCAHKEWFADLEHEKLTKEFLVTKIIPKLYCELKERGELKEEAPAGINNSFLVAQGDRLFAIRSNFFVQTVPTSDAIGCGEAAAFAVNALDKNAPVRDRMLRALRLASDCSDAVGAPYIFIDTKSQEYEIVEE